MLALLKRFLWDETAAAGLLRAILLGLSAAVIGGVIDLTAFVEPKWASVIGVGLAGLAGYVRAGDKNAPTTTAAAPTPPQGG